MADTWNLSLLLFDGGAGGASAAPAGGEAGGEAGAEAAVVTPGVLEDGTQVDNRLAARMEQQAQRRKARGETPQAPARRAAGQEAEETAEAEPEAPSLEDRWKDLKKGEFREQYSRDVQAAIQDRFKNQEDASGKLKAMQPMLQALMQKAGVETVEDLSNIILDDDSLYEDAAEEAGMTVEAYKQFKALQDEHDARAAQEAEDAEKQFFRQHIEKLVAQGEELKKVFPDFDLHKEMENETFRRLTAPNSGLRVEDAYYAVHHKELAPQAMAYGIARAKSQISQSIQANNLRPQEGAAKGGRSIDISMDPRNMTRQQREALKARVRRGERIVF